MADKLRSFLTSKPYFFISFCKSAEAFLTSRIALPNVRAIVGILLEPKNIRIKRKITSTSVPETSLKNKGIIAFRITKQIYN